MTQEEFDQKVEEWHNGNYDCSLHEFLGISHEEYVKIVEEGIK